MNKNLDRIENHLRILFEKNLVVLLLGGKNQPDLIDELIDVLRKNLTEISSGKILAPDRFVIQIFPDDFDNWIMHQNVLDKIAETIFSLGVNEGFIFHQPPSISLAKDQSIAPENYVIKANVSPSTKPMTETVGMTTPEQIEESQSVPIDASLIVGGRDNFPLRKSVINIGRHSDNDLSLDDPYISRHHVQLRAINQHFVIFDVGSTGGIYINGHKIIQSTLQNGDVIRIGMTNLIYLQEEISGSTTTTMPADRDDLPHEDDLS